MRRSSFAIVALSLFSQYLRATLRESIEPETSHIPRCVALVHINNRESLANAKAPSAIYSVYDSEVIDSLDCDDLKVGERLQFSGPGGVIADSAMRVNGIDVEPGHNAVVYLSAISTYFGMPMMLYADTQVKQVSHQSGAFMCARVPPTGPSLFWKNRTVVMHPAISNDPTLNEQALAEAMAWAGQQWSSIEESDFKFELGEPVLQRWVGFDWSEKRPNYNLVTIRKRTEGDFYSEWAHATGTLAMTMLTYSVTTGEIFDADIELNAELFQFANCVDSFSCSHFHDLKNTLTHEYGHVLGLDHPSLENKRARETTMFEEGRRGELKKRYLSHDDKAGASFIYPKNAPTGSCYSTKLAPKPKLKISPLDGGCSQSNTGGHPLIILFLFTLALIPLVRRTISARPRSC